ncbi:predicted protein [Histoplasma capsulatum G186AR]|uniref:Uncharacterized protein n=1 Tax=Ajellomyces capsulatus (strain G186AR / H82 / ATCC MYA-2454 / RMSCC 2432) TaxID=447093 RepID=C0NMF4_AJECG|nr:uncharacterized protein HCBG_04684 [Histoplasma capsulatum G186AR]EEH07805.1 predicted protein [Histoplasma capsulatum G186AR]
MIRWRGSFGKQHCGITDKNIITGCIMILRSILGPSYQLVGEPLLCIYGTLEFDISGNQPWNLEPWKGTLWERFTITSHDIGSNKREKKWNKISRKENQHQTRSQRKIGTLERFGICLLPLRSLVKCTTICQAISSRLLVAIGIIVLVRSPNLIS